MDGGMVGALFILGASFIIYFAPGIIAERRGRDGSGTIVVLNLLLGWTVIGWLVLLVVAFTGRSSRDREQQEEQLRLMRTLVAQQSLNASAANVPPAVPIAPPPVAPPVPTPVPEPEPAVEDTRTLAEIMADKEKSV